MSTYHKIIKNSGLLYIRTIVSLIVNIFTTRITLEALGVSDYGLYNVIGGAIGMLGFLSATMSSTTQRFINYAEGAGNTADIIKTLNNSLILHYIIASVSAIILLIAGIFFFNGILNIPAGQQNAAYVVYGCLIISTIFSITITPYDATIIAHENMAFYSILGIVDVLLKLLIAILILYLPAEQLIIYSILLAIESMLLRTIAKTYCRRKYDECKHTDIKNYDKARIKQMATFAGWNMANIATSMISLYGTNVIINHYFGTELNAAMGIATQLSGILMSMSTNMIKALTPALVKAEGGHKRDKMIAMSYTGCKFSLLVLSFLCIPIILYLPYILDLWLKNPPGWTSVFCLISLIAILFDQSTVLLYQSIMAEGHIKEYNFARSVTNIMPLFVSIIMFSALNFSPVWGLLNWVIWKSIVGSIVNLIFSHRNLGISYSAFWHKTYLPCILGIIPTTIIGLLLQNLSAELNNLIQISLLFILSIPIYWRLSLTKSERNTLKTFLTVKI